MKQRLWKTILTALCLAGVLIFAIGCKEDKVGETVAPPPRELAEKSLRQGNAPVAGGTQAQSQSAVK